MYSFAQRTDTTVLDEPLYGHYLVKSGIQHPMREEIIASMTCNADRVIQNVLLRKYDTPVVFFKQMTHFLVDVKLDFLDQMVNILSFRDPREILLSYSKVFATPSMEAIGIKQQCDFFQWLKKRDNVAVLVNTRDILLNPEQMLRRICEAVEIPFEKSMLSWEAGPRKEDGLWAPHWYRSVHKSTGFQAYKPKTEELPEYLVPLWKEAQKYYEYLDAHALKL